MKRNSLSTLLNVLEAASNPARAAVMLKKVGRRLFDNKGSLTTTQYHDWLAANAIRVDDFLHSFDPRLVEEMERFVTELNAHARDVLSSIPVPLGGSALIRVLYLLTLVRRPDVVVETGVGAGYSSACFLSALRRNGKGHLYSSDFPYFRLANPERYVGVVVDEALKERWSLFLEGDDANLPRILDECGAIDIFHYDSDKSYVGRQNALKKIAPAMADDGLIIMDDIQDNNFFYDLTQAQADKPFKVLTSKGEIKGKGKYVGLLGAA
jgi:predicted O-methyltransferase YrrM